MRKFTVRDFNALFPDEESCLRQIVGLIYPTGPDYIPCRTCGEETRHHKITGRKAFSCDRCRTQVHPLAGTIFEKSSTPLKSWLYAIYLVASTRTGISAAQLERELGVSYKTALRMYHEIRRLLQEDGLTLDGDVEADETYVGGRDSNRHKSKRGGKAGRGAAGKTIVAGIVQRKGKVVAKVVPDASAKSLIPNITKHVLPKANVFTDEWHSYSTLGEQGYTHSRVYHGQGVYVDGTASTNTIEGFWSLIKRGINGVYHSVSAEYLPLYLNEYAFRYNHRDDEAPMFEAIASRISKVRRGRYGAYAPIGE